MKKRIACAGIFVLGLSLGLGGLSAAEPAEPAAKQDVARLIAELGSKQYRARLAAAQALERMGQSALALLQQASQADDPEIRHRAEQLVEQIKREADTARLLEPKRLQLAVRDKPVPETVADLAAKSGFTVKLASADAGLAERKLTFDTGETTFWKAFEQLSEAAGLVERRDQTRTLDWSDAETDLRRLQAQARLQARLQMLRMQREGFALKGPSGDEPLILIPGSPVRLPTWYAGAVRIRAVPLPRSLAANAGETLVVLEATPQPGLTWLGLVGERVDLARDQAGRKLTPVALTEGSGLAGALIVQNKFVARRTQDDRTLLDLRYRPIRLKLATGPAHVLTELKGVLTAEVQTPPEPRVTVEHLLQAGGRIIRGSNGEVLKVLQVSQQPDGSCQVHLDFEDPSSTRDAFFIGPGRRGVLAMRARQIGAGGIPNERFGASNWSVLDKSGQPLPVIRRQDNFFWVGNGIRYETTLTYAPRNGSAAADKLVYSCPRTLQIDIPFTLHDVPLP